jgi:uncharacterized RDD family membrane protein YckC
LETRTFRITNDLLASPGQRFLNYIIDLLMQYALVFILSIFFGIIAAVSGREDILQGMQELSRWQEYLIGAIMILSYYNIMEATLSRTVGKYITKTIVVMEDGSKPAMRAILIRTLCRLIPFEPFSCFGPRGWHDSIAHTCVVKKDAFQEARNLFYSFDEIGRSEEI